MAGSIERSEEILRIALVNIFWGAIMVVQRFLLPFWLDLNVRDYDEWAKQSFNPAAITIFVASIFFSGLWYLTTLGSLPKYVPEKHNKLIRIRWIGFLLTNLIVCSFGVMYFCGETSSTALPWILVLLLLPTVLVYWVSTAISTPGLLAYPIIPQVGLLRKLFKIDQDN